MSTLPHYANTMATQRNIRFALSHACAVKWPVLPGVATTSSIPLSRYSRSGDMQGLAVSQARRAVIGRGISIAGADRRIATLIQHDAQYGGVAWASHRAGKPNRDI